MGQSICWYTWIITLCVLLCSPNQRCLAFLKMESSTDVPVYATSQLTTGKEENGKMADILRWKDNTDQTSLTSQPAYLFDTASQPSVTAAHDIFSAKAKINQNPKSNTKSLQAIKGLGTSYPTSESLKTSQDLDILFPTNSELPYTQNTARSNSVKDVSSLTMLMLTTAVRVTPSLQSVTEREDSATVLTGNAADDNLQTSSAISYSEGQINSLKSQFLVADLQQSNVTEGHISGYESTSVSASAALDGDDQMITPILRSENSDDKNKGFTEPAAVSNLSHVPGKIESQAALNDSHLVTVHILNTMSSQGTSNQSSDQHNVEPSEHINTGDTATLSVPFVSVLKDEWQNTNLGIDIEAETIHNGAVTEMQVLEQSPLYFDVNTNNVSDTENTTLISVTSSRTPETAYINIVSKLLVETKGEILPTVDTKQDEMLPAFSGPTFADATISTTEGDATTLTNIGDRVDPNMEEKTNANMPSLWTMTAFTVTQLQGSSTDRKVSEGKKHAEPAERVGTPEVHDVTAPTMAPFPAVTQANTASRNLRTTLVSPTIVSTDGRNSVSPTVSPAGSPSSEPAINDPNEEEEEEEDEDEDTDSEDESIEDDTELPTFASPNPTFQESLSDGINLTHLAGISFHIPDALEWEKQNQGLGKKRNLPQ
ncbi:armadillo-like helical domain-containing protein 4 isoform X2 [Protopterus annectens]|uniref:armadillo-like helical domain-containing protein 4 isoform X2 n=1 Tax=Protopterus annectens TaxID=7888 RepID=UPI001CFAD39F|nr:armadillo-like helical domain-containing protein 4 isoform X2 [Protopterus annectens]